MGLFDIFKKQTSEDLTLYATAKGTFVPMEEIPDDVFASGVLGTCCGIDPSEGKVYAPLDGTVTHLAESLHAIGITTGNGIDILIHVGIDTVEMAGDGFTPFVKENASIKKGQLLLSMDLGKIQEANHPAVVITAVTNSDDFAQVEAVASGNVEPGDPLLQVKK